MSENNSDKLLDFRVRVKLEVGDQFFFGTVLPRTAERINRIGEVLVQNDLAIAKHTSKPIKKVSVGKRFWRAMTGKYTVVDQIPAKKIGTARKNVVESMVTFDDTIADEVYQSTDWPLDFIDNMMDFFLTRTNRAY